jgi:hypothetical protein
MHRAFLAILLAVVSSTSSADWIMTSESEAGTTYVDPATLRKAGVKATMWELTDYKIVPDRVNPYQSVKRHYEFDCEEMALRTLSISTYSGKMGNGEIVLAISDPAKWFQVVPGSAGEIMWAIACRLGAKPT